MSFQTTPVGLVMTAIVVGRVGQPAFPARLEQALGGQSGLERLEAQGQVADARGLDRLDVELEATVRLVQVHPAVGDDPEPGLGLERRPQPVVAEPDALELALGVLQREVRVAGRRDRDAADLALDPQVGQGRVRADRDPDRPGRLADVQDANAERPGRCRRAVRRSIQGIHARQPNPSWTYRQRSSVPSRLRR